jgi:hypothetical protein
MMLAHCWHSEVLEKKRIAIGSDVANRGMILKIRYLKTSFIERPMIFLIRISLNYKK